MGEPPDTKRVFLPPLDLRGHDSAMLFERWLGHLHAARRLGYNVDLEVEYSTGHPWRINAYAVPAASTLSEQKHQP